MNPSRWNRIKSLAPTSALAFKSCDVAMLPHPSNPMGPRVVPWVGKGKTFKVGRNAAKRAARAGRTRKCWRTVPKHRFAA